MPTHALRRRPLSSGWTIEPLEIRRLMSLTVNGDAAPDPASSYHYTVAVSDPEKHFLTVEQSTTGNADDFGSFSQTGDGFWTESGNGSLDLMGIPGRTLYYRVSADGGATWSNTIDVTDNALITPQHVTVATGGSASLVASWDNDLYQPYGVNETYDITLKNGGTTVITIDDAMVSTGADGQRQFSLQDIAYPGDWTVSVRRHATDPISNTPISPSGWGDSDQSVHVYAPTPYGMSASNGDDFSPDKPKVTLSCCVDQPFANEIVVFYNADTGQQVGEAAVEDGCASTVVNNRVGGRTYHYFARAFAPDVNGNWVVCDGHSDIVTDVQNHTWWAAWSNGGTFDNIAETDVTGDLITKVDGVATRTGFSASIDNFDATESAMYFTDGTSLFGDSSTTGLANLKVARRAWDADAQVGSLSVTYTAPDGSQQSTSLDWAWVAP